VYGEEPYLSDYMFPRPLYRAFSNRELRVEARVFDFGENCFQRRFLLVGDGDKDFPQAVFLLDPGEDIDFTRVGVGSEILAAGVCKGIIAGYLFFDDCRVLKTGDQARS